MSKRIFDILIAIVITAAFVFGLSSCKKKPANEVRPKSPINIMVDGKKATFDKGFPYLNENDKTLAPLEFFTKYLGAKVNRNNEKILISKDKTVIELKIGERQAMINGGALDMTCPVIIADDVVMAPVRVVAEALGAAVSWDNVNRSVSVATSSPKTP
jgi:hypothetical protein